MERWNYLSTNQEEFVKSIVVIPVAPAPSSITTAITTTDNTAANDMNIPTIDNNNNNNPSVVIPTPIATEPTTSITTTTPAVGPLTAAIPPSPPRVGYPYAANVISGNPPNFSVLDYIKKAILKKKQFIPAKMAGGGNIRKQNIYLYFL